MPIITFLSNEFVSFDIGVRSSESTSGLSTFAVILRFFGEDFFHLYRLKSANISMPSVTLNNLPEQPRHMLSTVGFM